MLTGVFNCALRQAVAKISLALCVGEAPYFTFLSCNARSMPGGVSQSSNLEMKFLTAAVPPAVAIGMVFALACGVAKAGTVQFTVVENNINSGPSTNTATFDLPESPTPAPNSTSTLLYLTGVQETVVTSGPWGGSASYTGNIFFTESGGTTMIFDASERRYLVSVSGSLFDSFTDPTFIVGTYLGSDGNSITITDISATPQPAALPLFASGLGA
jgi:hypothetical protein